MKQRGDDNSVHSRLMLCRDPSFFTVCHADRVMIKRGCGGSLCKFDANLERAAMHEGHDDIKAFMAA